jgi:hypothetical protein
MIIKQIETTNKDYIRLAEKYGSVFNQKPWLSIYNSNLKLIGIYNLNSELIGFFNLFISKKYGFKYASVPPYSASNGFFINNLAQNNANKITFEKQVHQHIITYLKSLRLLFITTSFPTKVIDTQPYFWNNYKVIPNYTYQLDISIPIEDLFNNLTTEKRKSIKKAEKDLIEIKLSNDYTIILALVIKTFSRKENKINVEFINKLLFQFANTNNSFAYVAFKNNIPIACTFNIYYNNISYYLLGGYDSEKKHHGAGPACMWHSILKAKEIGITTFDFEGSMLPEVEKYFREFGGKITPYYTVQKAWLPLEFLLKFKFRNRF